MSLFIVDLSFGRPRPDEESVLRGPCGLAVKLAQMGMSVQPLDTVPAMVTLTRSRSVS